MAHTVSRHLGPYRLLNVVHTGHACQLWQGYDDVNRRFVGLKTVIDKTRINSEELKYLRHEYKVGRSLKHPNVIETLEFGWDRGQPYLAIEWFSAPNMKQRIFQAAADLPSLIPTIIDEAAEGLAYFHRQGWIHRDVKPDNFLVADDGSVKLIDFALAKRRRLIGWFAPRGKIQGTKSYLSPEQIRGKSLDVRSDLYGFACTIYELVSGKPPFTGVTVNELLTKHLRSPPPSLDGQNNNVTQDFAHLIRRSMAKDPALRPKSVDDFLEEYRKIRVFRVVPGGNS